MPNILVACLLFVPCVLVLAVHLARTERQINLTNSVDKTESDPSEEC